MVWENEYCHVVWVYGLSSDNNLLQLLDPEIPLLVTIIEKQSHFMLRDTQKNVHCNTDCLDKECDTRQMPITWGMVK